MKYNFMRFPGGKTKAVTFSYDDGSESDIRMTDTFNKYNLKCTYNLVGERIVNNEGISADYIRENIIAKGHEIANHGYNHKALDAVRAVEGVKDVLDSRIFLEREFDMIVRGMAFADRSINRFAKPDIYRDVKAYLKALDIVYTRCAGTDNDSFALPEDWHNWQPTAHHKNPDLPGYIDRFLELDVDSLYIASRAPRLMFIWGHSFEFEKNGNWDLLEDICKKLSGKDDTWYATCIDIYNYTQAYNSLVYSAESTKVYNPTLLDVWFDADGTLYCVKSGETINL